jgi:hypothetical protein
MCNNAMKRIVLGPAKKRKMAKARAPGRQGAASDTDADSDLAYDADGDETTAGDDPVVDLGDDSWAFDADNAGMEGVLCGSYVVGGWLMDDGVVLLLHVCRCGAGWDGQVHGSPRVLHRATQGHEVHNQILDATVVIGGNVQEARKS